VNTVPHQTLSAFIDHGLIAQTVQKDSVEAKGFISDLEELGIDFHQATEDLLLDGLGKFEHSYKTLIAAVGATIG